MATNTVPGGPADTVDRNRRDFLEVATATMGAVGAAAAAWPMVDSLNPSDRVMALATIEADLSPIQKGQAITVQWRGKPVFLRRRTDAEIEQARSVDLEQLPDPQPDAERVREPEWLIVIGVCTHLGCIPLGNEPGEPRGEYGGWFCACHGSHYDTAGRIRKGPAPANLPVPPYRFTDANTVEIG
jgi:ubiquinol-cytochrome c reductase iron-sulfur subunit